MTDDRRRKWLFPILISCGSLVLFAIGVAFFCFALYLQNTPTAKSIRDGTHPAFRDVPKNVSGR